MRPERPVFNLWAAYFYSGKTAIGVWRPGFESEFSGCYNVSSSHSAQVTLGFSCHMCKMGLNPLFCLLHDVAGGSNQLMPRKCLSGKALRLQGECRWPTGADGKCGECLVASSCLVCGS